MYDFTDYGRIDIRVEVVNGNPLNVVHGYDRPDRTVIRINAGSSEAAVNLVLTKVQVCELVYQLRKEGYKF